MPQKHVPLAEGPLNRKQLSRRERERRMHRRVIIGAVIVAVAIVAILGIGLYQQYVARPRTPVATVYDTPIRLAEYQKMYKYRREYYVNLIAQAQDQRTMLQASDANANALYIQYLESQIQQYQSTMSSLPLLVLDQMIDDELIRHEAAQRGLTVSTQEVDTRMEEAFGYYRPTPGPTATAGPTPTPFPTPTPITYEGYQELVTQWVQGEEAVSGLTEADLRRMIEGDLLREKVEAAVAAEVPTSGEQVQVRYMTFAIQDDAQAALARLQAGEDFAALAAEVSTDITTKDSGGELGWVARGEMNDDTFDTVAFGLQPGETSDVVALSGGAAIIQVEDRQADRAYTDAQLRAGQDRALEDWYNTQRDSDAVERSWDSTMVPLSA